MACKVFIFFFYYQLSDSLFIAGCVTHLYVRNIEQAASHKLRAVSKMQGLVARS